MVFIARLNTAARSSRRGVASPRPSPAKTIYSRGKHGGNRVAGLAADGDPLQTASRQRADIFGGSRLAPPAPGIRTILDPQS